jgi:signal transduction histidine kinase
MDRPDRSRSITLNARLGRSQSALPLCAPSERRIEIRSSPGRGTAFVLKLPRVDDEAARKLQ